MASERNHSATWALNHFKVKLIQKGTRSDLISLQPNTSYRNPAKNTTDDFYKILK
jgi:hypothetical protein